MTSARRGLTMLELMLAMSITAMVAAAISGMLSVISVGVDLRRDTRTIMVRGGTAQSRLSAYVAPSRAILASSSKSLTLWINDIRQGDTIHASEVRWISYDATARTLLVEFVEFPPAWTQVARDLADLEYPKNSNWANVLAAYRTTGHVHSMTLIDELNDLSVWLDAAKPLDAQYVKLDLTFTSANGDPVKLTIASAIRLHLQPIS